MKGLTYIFSRLLATYIQLEGCMEKTESVVSQLSSMDASIWQHERRWIISLVCSMWIEGHKKKRWLIGEYQSTFKCLDNDMEKSASFLS